MKALSKIDRQILTEHLETALREVAFARYKRLKVSARQAAIISAHIELMHALDITGRKDQVRHGLLFLLGFSSPALVQLDLIR